MCHQLIRFLGGCIKRNRIIALVICAIRNLLVGTVDRGRRSVNQMLKILAVATCFENIEKANQVGFHISIRVGDGVTHTSLCRKVNDHRRLVLLEQFSD